MADEPEVKELMQRIRKTAKECVALLILQEQLEKVGVCFPADDSHFPLLAEALRAERKRVLEEAAQLVEREDKQWMLRYELAAAIRALAQKGTQPCGVGAIGKQREGQGGEG